ncbi:hypothetical protein F2Q70_00042006 [Brassica cretica]|uniref:F-box/LRR-repeat protein 15/At3g58940/PEG3-like LRR domain-containing protein n=1 Tax=Brassica cretica TaxID=69181 RepID=A0A8S9K916_BRACR|nr:hypothetical protein F2Q70_00042006 [Brassica cretica]
MYYEKLCRHAVDLSQGELVEIDIWHFGSDSLLSYVADRFQNLVNCVSLNRCLEKWVIRILGEDDSNIVMLLRPKCVSFRILGEDDSNIVMLLRSKCVSFRLSGCYEKMILTFSSNLRSLKVAQCHEITSEGLTEAVAKLPLLEELEVSYCSLSEESLKVIGQSCPNLKTLKKNCVGYRRPRDECDDVALAIAETMPHT